MKKLIIVLIPICFVLQTCVKDKEFSLEGKWSMTFSRKWFRGATWDSSLKRYKISGTTCSASPDDHYWDDGGDAGVFEVIRKGTEYFFTEKPNNEWDTSINYFNIRKEGDSFILADNFKTVNRVLNVFGGWDYFTFDYFDILKVKCTSNNTLSGRMTLILDDNCKPPYSGKKRANILLVKLTKIN